MSERTKRILQLSSLKSATQESGQQIDDDNIDVFQPVQGPLQEVESNLNLKKAIAITDNSENTNEDMPSCSYQCIPKKLEPLKLNIRRNCLVNTCYKARRGSDSFSDFSSGSNDNYAPSSSASSSSESSQEIELQENTALETSNRQEITASSPIPKIGKKRVRNEDNWSKNKKKKLKNSGKSYYTKSGKSIEARKIKAPCSEKCVQKCSTKISDEQRKRIFDEFWALASFQRQRDFLGSCVEQLVLKYRRISSAEPRRPNSAFYFHVNGQKVRVCKIFLINTLGIAEKTLRTVIQAKATGTGIIPEDGRGKHGKHAKVDEDLKKSVSDHINSVPRIESHYVRSDTTREFIDGGLSISELYRNYVKERGIANKPTASFDMYSRIFNKNFNIGFFVPKKDQCDLCESYKNASGKNKENIETKYKQHQLEKVLSRKELDRDSQRAKSQEIFLAVYDLQAVLPVPMGDSSAFFYKSRLNCYNFTISETERDKTCCYFWHEGLGHRGVTEIGTCIFKHLQELANANPGIEVVFYSDNCGGQQKNKYLVGMYLYAVEHLEIKSITHKYLVRGHTQNKGDSVHSIIERCLKRAKRSGPIYVPEQIVSIIRTAKKTGNPFIVKELSTDTFYDLKALYEETSPNLLKNINGDEFKISEVRLLRFEKGSTFINYKTSYEQQEWNSIDIQPKKRRSAQAKKIKDVILKPAYKNKIEIADNKKKDLKNLVESNIIPQFYKNFFENVCA